MTLVCPSPDEMTGQALSLLPRGRAWCTHEVGPRPGTILHGFWHSVGSVFSFLASRLCALHPEFFCASHSETRDLWLAEYGLPDECDPFPNICAKVAARGGPHCEVYRQIAAEAGWDIDCYEQDVSCGAIADCILVDSAASFAANGQAAATVYIRVYRETSPAYVGPLRGSAYADCFIADGLLDCPPDLSSLICILNRIVHAHVRVEYVLGDPRTTLTDADLSADSGINVTGEYSA